MIDDRPIDEISRIEARPDLIDGIGLRAAGE
jgi:hypothetical protein